MPAPARRPRTLGVDESPRTDGRRQKVPRQREVNDYTARRVCRQLGIAEP